MNNEHDLDIYIKIIGYLVTMQTAIIAEAYCSYCQHYVTVQSYLKMSTWIIGTIIFKFVKPVDLFEFDI